MNDNFHISVMLPGSEAEKEYQRQIEQQKKSARLNAKIDWSGATSQSLAAEFRAQVAASRELDAERKRQAENEKRIAAGELKPFEVDGHPIHRVDFVVTPAGVKVSKINRNENTRQDTTVSTETKPVDLKAAREWLEANGYIVRSWKDTNGNIAGMRAWFGRLWPIRTRSEIGAARARLADSRARGTNQVDTTTIDLAYDM